MTDQTNLSSRADLLDAVAAAGRVSSTAAVLFHAALSERLGLGPADSKAYDLLLRNGAMTAGQIAEHVGLTSGSVTSLIDRLEKRGFVRREHDTADRRRVIIHADPARMAEAAPLMAGFLDDMNALMAAYSDDELRLLLDFMRRAAALSQNALAGLKA